MQVNRCKITCTTISYLLSLVWQQSPMAKILSWVIADPLNFQSRSTHAAGSGKLRPIPERSVARARTPRIRSRSCERSAREKGIKQRKIEKEKKRKGWGRKRKSQQRTAEAEGTWSELSRREGVAARYWRVVRGAHGSHAARISIPTDPARRGADIQGRLNNNELPRSWNDWNDPPIISHVWGLITWKK